MKYINPIEASEAESVTAFSKQLSILSFNSHLLRCQYSI